MWDALPGHNIGNLTVGCCCVGVRPVPRVQEILTDAAELGTEFVSREADVMGCRLGIMSDLMFDAF